MDQFFILEHPTKGTVTDLPYDRDEKFHFSWSNLRSDERNVRFYALPNARRMLDLAHQHGLTDVAIMRSPAEPGDGWERVT